LMALRGRSPTEFERREMVKPLKPRLTLTP
jgi:hypothetical protein